MRTKSFKLPVSPSTGKVSAICLMPEHPVCVMTLAHGAGAGMEHSFMTALANGLAEKNIATLRFNFPFAEQKKFRPDSPAVAHQTIAAAIEKAKDLFPGVPVFAGGKSFGGRMSSQYLSAQTEKNVKGVIFYGFPLHPAGKPSIERAEHLRAVQMPMLFLQGTKDALATWHLIEPLCKSLRKSTLVKIEGADHSFKTGKTDTMTLLVNATAGWINKIIKLGKSPRV